MLGFRLPGPLDDWPLSMKPEHHSRPCLSALAGSLVYWHNQPQTAFFSFPPQQAATCFIRHLVCGDARCLYAPCAYLLAASKSSEALSDHVLGEFTRSEKKDLDSVIAEACDAVERWIEEEDMAKVMTQVNSPR